MKTPEPITAQQAGEAVGNIVDRRRQIADPHLDEFMYAAHDGRELLRVVLKRHRGIPDWVAEADVHDALILHVRRWWEWVEDDLALLQRAEKLDLNRKEVGNALNLGSGQGIVDRITADHRKLARLRGEPAPDELATPPDQDRATRQQCWLEAHRTTLDEARTAVLAHKGLGSDEAYASLLDVAREPWTPTTMTLMSYAVFDLCQSPAVRDLSDEQPVHAAIDHWNTLTEDYRTSADGHWAGQGSGEEP